MNVPASSRLHPARRRAAVFFLTLGFWSGVLTTGFFLFMVHRLWLRESAGRSAVRTLGISPDLLTVTWVDYDQFMWIERGGKRIGGYVMMVRRTDDNLAYELTSRVRMGVNAGAGDIQTTIDAYVHMNDRFEMDLFQGEISALGAKISAEAFVDKLTMYYRLRGPEMLVAGGSATSMTKLERAVMLADAIRPVVTQNGKLRPGAKWSTLASDPIAGKFSVPVEVRVVAEEKIELEGQTVAAFRVVEQAGENETVSWYDADGKPLKTDLGNGLVMIRAKRDEVYEAFPDFKLPRAFEDLDRAALAAEAAKNPDAKIGDALSFLSQR